MSFTGFQLGLSDDLLEASKKVVESSAEYKKFFDATLKKFGVTSPDELSGEKKKEFFDYIDKNYNSSKEKGEDGKVEGYGNKKKSVKENNDPDEDGPTPTPENEEEAKVLPVQEDLDENMSSGDMIKKLFKVKNDKEVNGIANLMNMTDTKVLLKMKKDNPKGFARMIAKVGELPAMEEVEEEE